MNYTLSLAALFFYALGTAYHLLLFQKKVEHKAFFALLIGALAIICHGALTYHLIVSPAGIDFSLFKASVAISCGIVVISAILNIRKPVRSLVLFAYPIAILSLLCLLLFSPDTWNTSTTQGGLIAHILFSVTAYSVFTLAAAQAAMLYAQNKSLRTNYNGLLVKNLPPLQTMESILFEMLYSGVILLSIAILLGFMFVEDVFAQKLAHKTVFSIVSLGVFATLLAGHKIRGWRGLTASRWTLTGCFFLMLGYFGSKIVVELLL